MGDRVGRNDGHRVRDDAGLEPLDLSHLAGLLRDAHILVDHADAAQAGERDGEARLGHRIHGGRNQGNVEPNAACEGCGQYGIARKRFRVAGFQENIVEREAFGDLVGTHGRGLWNAAHQVNDFEPGPPVGDLGEDGGLV